YRDIESLSGAGVPVYGDAGPDGGYRLLGGYRTRLTGLTAAEAQALSLAGMPRAAAELGLGTVLATAQLKLQAALPAELGDRAAAIGERFLLDAPGWYHDGDTSPYLAAVADAVWNQRRIEVRYRRWTAPTDVTRTLDPHGIVLKAGKWYVVAKAQGSGVRSVRAFRIYRVNHILGLTDTGERFTREDGFDLAAFWASGVAGFRAGLWQGEATIRLSPAGRERTAEMMSSAVISAVEATASAAGDDGWVTAVVPIESLIHAHQDFLRLGADVEVLEPAGLRQRLAETSRELARIYRGSQLGPSDSA
ncbi:MAG TPA: WYL domain-containing protein, partial [Streptosporangiaceae bacterium]|nr:WYL domain-containing protein [Streptosporangiaceae bacterium]